MAVIDAEAVRTCAIRREHRPGCHANTFLERAAMEPERVDRLRQLHPQKVASTRSTDARTGREIAADRLRYLCLLRSKRLAQVAQVSLVSAALQIRGDGELRWNAGRDATHQLAPLDVLR